MVGVLAVFTLTFFREYFNRFTLLSDEFVLDLLEFLPMLCQPLAIVTVNPEP